MTAAEIRTRLAAIRPIADEARDDANALAKSRRERAIAVALDPATYPAWIAAEADSHAKHTLAKELVAEMDELRQALKAAERAEADHARLASVREANAEHARSPAQVILRALLARPALGSPANITASVEVILPHRLDRQGIERWAVANAELLTNQFKLDHAIRHANPGARAA